MQSLKRKIGSCKFHILALDCATTSRLFGNGLQDESRNDIIILKDCDTKVKEYRECKFRKWARSKMPNESPKVGAIMSVEVRSTKGKTNK
jgi:hypothetical protein